MKQIYIKTTKLKKSKGNPFNHLIHANYLIKKDERSGCTNIFLNQNIGKGPPGRARNPEAINRMLQSIQSYYNEFKYLIINKPNLFHTILNY